MARTKRYVTLRESRKAERSSVLSRKEGLNYVPTTCRDQAAGCDKETTLLQSIKSFCKRPPIHRYFDSLEQNFHLQFLSQGLTRLLDVPLKVKPRDIDSAQSRPRREQTHDAASLLLVMIGTVSFTMGSENDHDDEGNERTQGRGCVAMLGSSDRRNHSSLKKESWPMSLLR